MLFAEGRYLDALDAYQQRAEGRAARQRPRGRAIGRHRSRRCASRSSTWRAREAEKLVHGATRTSPDAIALYGDALWASGLFEEAEAAVPATRWRSAPELARGHHGMARVARRAQPARRGDERGAGGAAAVAARPRDPPHRRHDLRADAQVRGGGRRLLATTSTCCRTRTTARRPTGRAPRSGSCARSASACRSRRIRAPTTRLYTVDFRLVNDKVVVRAKVNDASAQDFVVDTGVGEHRHHASDGAAARHHADHLHAQRRRRRRRPARPAAGAHRLARARLAEAAQRAVPDQEPAAARHPGRRKPRACRRSRSATR